MGEPWRGDFLSAAQLQVLLFLGSSLAALVLARVTLAAGGTAVDWRRNPAWLAMVVLLLTVTLVVAVWVSLTAGEVISMAVTALVVPLLLIGFVAGIDRRTLRILLVCVAAAGLIAIVVRTLQSLVGPNRPAPLPSGGVGEQPQEPVQATLLGVAILVAVVVVVILVLARLALRRGPALTMDDEMREIADDEEEGLDQRRRRRRRFRRRPAPVDAVAAYRDLLEDLEDRPPVAREPGETPSEHAARLRHAGVSGLALDLLAADYGLARFGGQPHDCRAPPGDHAVRRPPATAPGGARRGPCGTGRRGRCARGRRGHGARRLTGIGRAVAQASAWLHGRRADGADLSDNRRMPKPDLLPAVTTVTIYGEDWCGDCRRSKRWLNSSGIDWVYIDRGADPAVRRMLADAGYLAIPPVVVLPGGAVLVEPSNTELAEAVAAVA